MPRYDYDDDDYDDFRIRRPRRRAPREAPHSGLGIASLFIAIVMGIGMFILFSIAVVISLRQNGQVNDNDPVVVALGLGLLGGCGMSLVGLVLGIIGALQPDRKALYGILGSVFNGMILVGVGGIICLGILAG
jgi:hypothetical protein